MAEGESMVFVDASPGQEESIEVVNENTDEADIIAADITRQLAVDTTKEGIAHRQDIAQAEVLPTKTKGGLFYNTQDGLNEGKSMVKSKPRIDERIQECIASLSELLQNPAYAPFHAVGKDVLDETCMEPGRYKGVHYSLDLFTRTEGIIQTLVNAVTGTVKIVQVFGPPGFGKTSTLIQVGHDVTKRGFDVIYLTARNLETFGEVARELIYVLVDGQVGYSSPDPASEAINHLKSFPNKTLLILDHIDELEHEQRSQVQQFVIKIAQNAPNACIMTASRNKLHFGFAVTELSIPLPSMNEENSAQLLKKACTAIKDEDARTLSILCGGIPLLLRIFGSLLEGLPAKDLIADIQKKDSAIFHHCSIQELPEELRIVQLYDVWFNHLTDELQRSVVSLCVFPMWFTVSLAKVVIGEARSVSRQIFQLTCTSYLTYDGEESYLIHSFIKKFCLQKADNNRLLGNTLRNARTALISYYIDRILQLNQEFLSKDSQKAIRGFTAEQANIKSVLHACANNVSPLTDKCVHAANLSAEFFAKMLQRSEFEEIFKAFLVCYPVEHPYHSYCLVSIGLKIVYSHLEKDLEIGERYLGKALRLMNCLGTREPQFHAQCLGKLARYYAMVGNHAQALPFAEDAIRMAQQSQDRNRLAMLGVAYNDYAVCLGFDNQIQRARSIRQDKMLKIYRSELGDHHPFTATALHYLAKDCRVLHDQVSAERFIREALEIRLEILGPNHLETAQSHYESGIILDEISQTSQQSGNEDISQTSQQSANKDALQALIEAKKVQEKVPERKADLLKTLEALHRILSRGEDSEREQLKHEIEAQIKSIQTRRPEEN